MATPLPLAKTDEVTLLQALNCLDKHALVGPRNPHRMRRIDTKFLLPRAQLPQLIELLRHCYSVQDDGGRRVFNYKTTYYDTPDRLFYHMHLRERRNCLKVRHRLYADAGQAFLEVKRRHADRSTSKARALAKATAPLIPSRGVRFLMEQRVPQIERLRARQCVSYSRIILEDPARTERITLDFGVFFRGLQAPAESRIGLGEICIAESKQQIRANNTPFLDLMADTGRVPNAISKYCIGSSLLSARAKGIPLPLPPDPGCVGGR